MAHDRRAMAGSIVYMSGRVWAVADVETTESGLIVPCDIRADPGARVALDDFDAGPGQSVLLMSPRALFCPPATKAEGGAALFTWQVSARGWALANTEIDEPRLDAACLDP